MTHNDYETPMSENDVAMTKVQIGTQLQTQNNPPPASYLPEIVNVVNAVEGLLPLDVAKKVEDIKNQALALIDVLRANEALNQTKIGFAENHLRHFLHWVFKVHDGRP